MPRPKAGEPREDYVGRCIPVVMAEGTAKDEAQAAAVCYSMYDQHKKAVLVRFANFILRRKKR